MTATRRWCLVAVAALLLITSPLIGPLIRPAGADPVTPAALLARIKASEGQPYSGYVQTLGTLNLPLSDDFSGVAGLFGQRTDMRVWWRNVDDWRVDQVTATGETDLIHDAGGTTSWDYESNRATRTGPAVIRLPQASDLTPPALAHDLLDSARTSEVTPLGVARIAGVDAPGLRLKPSDPQTSITRVDVWVEPRTGLPLKVAVYGANQGRAALTSSFDTVSLDRPPAAETAFAPAPGVRSRFEDVVDLAAAANAYAPFFAPMTLNGWNRRGDGIGAVGVYGRGPTLLIAIPLRDRVAGPLRTQLRLTSGATETAAGTALTQDPLNLLLTTTRLRNHTWLLAGTVTATALAAAASDLAADPQLQGNDQAATP